MTSPETRKLRVLAVDDEKSFTNLVRLRLEKTGRFEVRCLHLGREVIPTAQDWSPDIILLDYLMPDLDGGKVFQRLKDSPQLKHIPVILITAMAREDTPLERGVRPKRLTLAKPLSFETLVNAIDTLTGDPTVREAV